MDNYLRERVTIGIALFLLTGTAWGSEESPPVLDIRATSLAQLRSLKITSLSRKQEPVSKAASSVYVLTRDAIQRMGVTHIPEALRYVPGVEVARINATQWAVSIRGFNSRTANKLLVMIDGRSIYSPLFSGVLWEEKDLVLDDVERIEIIRGTGGTQWGANAVNGVINIITRDAASTLGGFATLGAGLEDRNLVQARYGWQVSSTTAARVYGKFTRTDDGGTGPVEDEGHMSVAGFRVDHSTAEWGQLTAQGDLYDGSIGPSYEGLGNPGQEHNGGNLMLKWSYASSADTQHDLNTYYDSTTLKVPQLIDKRHLINLDYQLTQRWHRHTLVTGFGYREADDDIRDTPVLRITPDQRTDQYKSLFALDDIAFLDNRLHLIIGTKYELNDYSGEEWEPSIRTSYAFTERLMVWGAWSNAVRVPSRLEHDFSIGSLSGNRNLQPEHVSYYSFGIRQQWDRWQWDLTGYLGQYTDLLSIEPPTLGNEMEGDVKGMEANVSVQAATAWVLRFNYSHLDMDLGLSENSSGFTDPENVSGSSPPNMAQIMSLWDINQHWQLNGYLRYVDALPAQQVDDYWAGDLTLMWRPDPLTRIQLTGHHLGHEEHQEWGGLANAVEYDWVVYVSRDF